MSLQSGIGPIGGYFGLEIIPKFQLPHPRGIPVNFGRGGLELIISIRGYETVWIPDYICPSVPMFLSQMGVSCKIYSVGENFEPLRMPSRKKNEAFLYVNYFGIKDGYCRFLERTCSDLILDLTQAFYYIPRFADSFNSARKFLGVPDGGFVYFGRNREKNKIVLGESFSYDCCGPLLKRLSGDVAGGYKDFQSLSSYWRNLHVAKMSNISIQILKSCDLKQMAKKRRENCSYLHRRLRPKQKLQWGRVAAPLIYPYFAGAESQALRDYLIMNKIFCPSYWPGVPEQTKLNVRLSDIVFLPIDHRYGRTEMNIIVDLIQRFDAR